MPKRRKRRTPAPANPADPPRNLALTGLKSVYRQWQSAVKTAAVQAEAPAAVAEDERRSKVSEHDLEWFRRKVGPVQPVNTRNRIVPALPRPQPLPLQRWADEAAVLRESLSDEYGGEWLLETDESLSYRRSGLGADVVRKLRKGHWTVMAQIDLHGLRVDEARDVVGQFLRDCVRQEKRCVRIIHGKGLGSINRTPVLKEKVRRWLTQREEVLAFTEARPDDGGSGVVLALLKRAHD